MTYQSDLKKLIQSLDSLTNKQASVTVDEENVCELTLTIIPNDGLYRNGKFDFKISFDDRPRAYPYEMPLVICTTPIYHPNIDNEEHNLTNVCVDWENSFCIANVIQAILFLFYNPNVGDSLSSMFTGSESEDEFAENVRKSLMGEDVEWVSLEYNQVESVSFERNQVIDDETNAPSDVDPVTENTEATSSNTNTNSLPQETNVTPHTISDTSNSDTTADSNDNVIPENLSECDNANDTDGSIVSSPCKDTEFTAGEQSVVKTLERHNSFCPTVEIKPNIPPKSYQTWNFVLQTASSLLTYIGLLNRDHIYERIR